MVLTHPFHCPTQVISGHDFDEAVEALLDGRSWALITSQGWQERGAIDRLVERCGAPNVIISNIEANPTISSVLRHAGESSDFNVAVALGGGSVLDAAKGIIALQGLKRDAEPLMRHLQEGVPLPGDMSPAPIIAIPTTAGTGSEVTRWGTIWGDDGIKFSINDPSLWPSHAVLDPKLCVLMPRRLTLATALDALSHAMESVWNRRHMPVTDDIARGVIRLLRRNLDMTLERPDDLACREAIQCAALNAGLAMGTTQTALAHSISYPFTSRFGVPHGIACSFTLPEVSRYNLVENAERLLPIAEGLDCALEEIPTVLETWFEQLGIGEELSRHVSPEVTDQFGDNLITRARAANNIREIDGQGARALARAALDRFCPVRPREIA